MNKFNTHLLVVSDVEVDLDHFEENPADSAEFAHSRQNAWDIVRERVPAELPRVW